MNRLFEKYFKLPLISIQDDLSPTIVLTQDGYRAFDFRRLLHPSDIKKIMNCLNGEIKYKIKGKLTHTGGVVSLDDTEILFIRSWGRLTGMGGLALKSEKAVEIQDDFCDWIIEQLTIKQKK